MIFSYALKSEISEGEKERKRKKSLSLGSEKFTRISRFARFRRIGMADRWPLRACNEYECDSFLVNVGHRDGEPRFARAIFRNEKESHGSRA